MKTTPALWQSVMRGSLLTPMLLGLSMAAQAEELPAPIKAMEAKGLRIMGSFDAPAGLKGYAAEYQKQGLALYLTADGQHVLTGQLLDANGKDMTRAPLEQLVYKPMSAETWQDLQNTRWIQDGRTDAPRVLYMFTDANCPYCHQFWEMSRPWVASGKVQIRHILVGIIRADSKNKAATLLSAKDPVTALKDYEDSPSSQRAKSDAEVPAAIGKQLDANLALMSSLGLNATPSILYLDDNQILQAQRGVPGELTIDSVMGPQ
ncbi:thiol:disulfide interchange protein DsbG [Pokkaliibacter plantistimulans]|nr:thiol:disulfide interchange protein DsbG [Pokkaliibacter plantistimulans]